MLATPIKLRGAEGSSAVDDFPAPGKEAGQRSGPAKDIRQILGFATGALAFLFTAPSLAADAAVGKKLFQQRCALCHIAERGDNGGAQGPMLAGIFGRTAAKNSNFPYTKALSNANLTWDAATLDGFLKSPTAMVRGTKMVIAVPRQSDRDNLIAYFQSVAGATAGPSLGVATEPEQGDMDWRKDAPGRLHRIDLAHLPIPFATPSARNFPKLIDKPASANLALPPGFKIDVFASALEGPRQMAVAPNGDVFVSETRAGRVTILHPSADGAKAARKDVYARSLDEPFGVAFYPDAKNPKWLYVAENTRVIRYAYKPGDKKPLGTPEVVVADLPAGGGHSTRDIAFSADGARLFVSVGSASNAAETMPKKSLEEIKAWEAQHGLGAAWDTETNRAVVLAFPVAGKGPGKIFARGLRNCVSLSIQPVTHDVWCTTNERDGRGNDLVPDYVTRVKEGGFYGWPWYYMGANEDPRMKGDRPDLKGKAIVPDVPLQAHSAALNLTFYTATSGKSAFPAAYVGDGIVSLHGSWNRSYRTGHKLVRVRMKNGVPTGEYEDFLTGFIVDDGNAWGRPAATTVLADGSLLMSDDGGDLIYRISYTP